MDFWLLLILAFSVGEKVAQPQNLKNKFSFFTCPLWLYLSREEIYIPSPSSHQSQHSRANTCRFCLILLVS